MLIAANKKNQIQYSKGNKTLLILVRLYSNFICVSVCLFVCNMLVMYYVY